MLGVDQGLAATTMYPGASAATATAGGATKEPTAQPTMLSQSPSQQSHGAVLLDAWPWHGISIEAGVESAPVAGACTGVPAMATPWTQSISPRNAFRNGRCFRMLAAL